LFSTRVRVRSAAACGCPVTRRRAPRWSAVIHDWCSIRPMAFSDLTVVKVLSARARAMDALLCLVATRVHDCPESGGRMMLRPASVACEAAGARNRHAAAVTPGIVFNRERRELTVRLAVVFSARSRTASIFLLLPMNGGACGVDGASKGNVGCAIRCYHKPLTPLRGNYVAVLAALPCTRRRLVFSRAARGKSTRSATAFVESIPNYT